MVFIIIFLKSLLFDECRFCTEIECGEEKVHLLNDDRSLGTVELLTYSEPSMIQWNMKK